MTLSPHVAVAALDPGQVDDVALALSRDHVAIRVVHGERMLDLPALFAELQATWQFPNYFGFNWNAVDDCLADLSCAVPNGHSSRWSRTLTCSWASHPSSAT